MMLVVRRKSNQEMWKGWFHGMYNVDMEEDLVSVIIPNPRISPSQIIEK